MLSNHFFFKVVKSRDFVRKSLMLEVFCRRDLIFMLFVHRVSNSQLICTIRGIQEKILTASYQETGTVVEAGLSVTDIATWATHMTQVFSNGF